jgi:hypothetical protein
MSGTKYLVVVVEIEVVAAGVVVDAVNCLCLVSCHCAPPARSVTSSYAQVRNNSRRGSLHVP